MADDVLTRNSADELALRVVQSSGDTGMNKDDVCTRDSQGRLSVRTVGGSGGGDYLPLSGGTLTGPLTINLGETTEEYSNETVLTFTLKRPSGEIKTEAIKQTSVGLDFGGAYFGQVGDIIPSSSSSALGGFGSLWGRIFVKKIYNGSDIDVPTTGGTMVVATPPADNGTYVLKATVVDGVITTEWVLES